MHSEHSFGRKCRRMICVVLLALLLSSCSTAQYPDSAFLGSWQAVKGEQGGVEVNLKDIDAHIALTLEASGKATLEIGDQARDGKWSPQEDDKGITLKVDEETLTFSKIRENTLKGPLDGVTLTLEKDE